ncbi:MAG: hypothetical protein JWM33_420 [Caulobacteraceae bacterium]|nr:hypothetical protein [Caulobacteraceae bacterium]
MLAAVAQVKLQFLALLLFAFALPAQAHSVDEYLDATTMAVASDHVTLKVNLTPGVNVAARVLAGIDANGDGALSPAEQAAYVAAVQGDMNLTLDGQLLDLRPGPAAFPSVEAVSKGVGDIAMSFTADVREADGPHRLDLVNRHQSGLAVYLVNALQPDDPRVQILSQDRNFNQSSYTLNFQVGAPAAAAGASLAASDRWAVTGTYFWRGVRHILTGYDHLLFVAALVLAAASLWDLVKVVTAFTIAHSLTLALATFGLVHVSGRLVEPLIAASIVFVAVQNLVWPNAAHGRSRLAVAFGFGLVHGLGFASGLLELMHQMPKATTLLALLGFSLGIEAGNQLVLLPLFAAVRSAARLPREPAARQRLAKLIQRVGSGVIAAAGLVFLCLAVAGAA